MGWFILLIVLAALIGLVYLLNIFVADTGNQAFLYSVAALVFLTAAAGGLYQYSQVMPISECNEEAKVIEIDGVKFKQVHN